jgi:LacI family transcriptional regulator
MDAGIPVDEKLILTGDFRSDSGYEGCRSLLSLPKPPTAVFACNDLMALGALNAAHEMGIKIPRQLSIIGFDDIALSSFIVPHLTTISQPKHEMGRRVAELLVERIKKKNISQRNEILKTKLIIRDSCMPPANRTK